MVEVGRAEEKLPRVFEDTNRLPASLTGFQVLKADRNMFKAQSRRTTEDGGGVERCVMGCVSFLHTSVFDSDTTEGNEDGSDA